MARSIFSSASKRVSSITVPRLLRALRSSVHLRARWGAWSMRVLVGRHRSDQRADLLAGDGPDDRVLPLGPEDQHRQAILHTQAESGGVDDLEAAAQSLLERDRVEFEG